MQRVMLFVAMLNAVMLNAGVAMDVMLSVVFFYCYAERRYAECWYAECRYSESHGAR